MPPAQSNNDSAFHSNQQNKGYIQWFSLAWSKCLLQIIVQNVQSEPQQNVHISPSNNDGDCCCPKTNMHWFKKAHLALSLVHMLVAELLLLDH